MKSIKQINYKEIELDDEFRTDDLNDGDFLKIIAENKPVTIVAISYTLQTTNGDQLVNTLKSKKYIEEDDE